MPNFLRPDIGKKRKYELHIPKPKLPDTPIVDQPFQYAYVHVSTWCLRDLLKKLNQSDIYLMFSLIKVMRKNENVLLNRLGNPAATKNEILSALDCATRHQENILTKLIKAQVIGRYRHPTESITTYFVNPYVMFYGTKIPDSVYEMFTDSPWRLYARSYGVDDVEL